MNDAEDILLFHIYIYNKIEVVLLEVLKSIILTVEFAQDLALMHPKELRSRTNTHFIFWG